MSRNYLDILDKLGNKLLVTDGGLETTLIFQDGIDLPHFAAFPLLDSELGRAALRRYYESYAAAARRSGAGCILDTATFRASPEWASRRTAISSHSRMTSSMLLTTACCIFWRSYGVRDEAMRLSCSADKE